MFATTIGLAGLPLGSTGCSVAPFQAVSSAEGRAHEPSLAVFDHGMTVAWYDTRADRGDLYARRLDDDGRPVGPEMPLTQGPNDALEPDVQPLPGDAFAMAWYEKALDGRLQPRVGVWTRDGVRRWAKAVSAAGRNALVRVAGSRLLVAWVQDDGEDRAGVWAGWWTLDGDVVSPPRRLADAGRTTWNLNAAVAGPDPATPASSAARAGRAWVVFDARAGTRAEEIFAVDASPDATSPAVRLTADDGAPSKYPDLALARDRLALAWFDERDGNQEVYLAVGPRARLDDRRATAGLPASRITTSAGHSIGAYLAWNGDRLGLAWSDDTSGQHEVFMQTFGADGAAREPARPLTQTAASSLIPAIRPWRSGFALTWNEYDASGGAGHAATAPSTVVATLVP